MCPKYNDGYLMFCKYMYITGTLDQVTTVAIFNRANCKIYSIVDSSSDVVHEIFGLQTPKHIGLTYFGGC